jgi:hypothetical protein
MNLKVFNFQIFKITSIYIYSFLLYKYIDPLCPVFKLSYILNKAEPDKEEKYLMLVKGALVQIEVNT